MIKKCKHEWKNKYSEELLREPSAVKCEKCKTDGMAFWKIEVRDESGKLIK